MELDDLVIGFHNWKAALEIGPSREHGGTCLDTDASVLRIEVRVARSQFWECR